MIVIGFLTFIEACKKPVAASSGEDVSNWFNQSLETLDLQLARLEEYVTTKKDLNSVRSQFQITRIEYKRIEMLVEYFFQGHSKRINGPALPDVKPEDNQVWPPHGFQVIEQMIYGVSKLDFPAADLINEIRLLRADLTFVRVQFKAQTILPRHVRELVQHELIRIAVMGITGFDAPVSQLSLAESAASLSGISKLISLWPPTNLQDSTETIAKINEAIAVLDKHNSFNDFDRLGFIKNQLMPLSESLADYPDQENQEDKLFIKPFKGTLSELMRGEGFEPDAYASIQDAKSTPAKIDLGSVLFGDTRLSRLHNMSCGTCHQPDKYFTDGRTLSIGNVHGTIKRNTPTLYYSGLQAAQFYDLRSSTLEDQIGDVMQNAAEFGIPADKVWRRLASDTMIRRLVFLSYGVDSLSGYQIRNALAAYVRTLNPFSSGFDRYMDGDTSAMSPEAKQGFNIFMGKAKCATCHFIPLFNGTVPPFYTKHESEVIGVPAEVRWSAASIDQDPGRFKLNQLAPFLYAFKTPGIRNIVRTAPYMHNGVFKDLHDVITFYEKGGGVGIGIDIGWQTLPFDNLSLTQNERESLVRFMESLSDN